MKNVHSLEWSQTFQFLWIVTAIAAVRILPGTEPPHPLLHPSPNTFCPQTPTHLILFCRTLYDWSSYRLTQLHTPNIYRPIDTPWGGIYTTLHMEMISINYHSPLTRQRGWGETKEPRQQEHFSGVMCTMCNEQRKGHLTHFCQNEFIYFKHLIL